MREDGSREISGIARGVIYKTNNRTELMSQKAIKNGDNGDVHKGQAHVKKTDLTFWSSDLINTWITTKPDLQWSVMQQNNANEAHPVTERSYGARYNIVSSHDYKFCSPRHLRNIRVICKFLKSPKTGQYNLHKNIIVEFASQNTSQNGTECIYICKF
jgi:hypothetical protein